MSHEAQHVATGEGSPERPPTYRETMARLGGAQKTAKGAPGYSRYVNRRLGRRLAALAYRAGLIPNQVTAVSAAFSAAGIALLATVPSGFVVGLVVTLFLLLGYALDSADGQVARLRGMSSSAGEWLDHVIDCAKIVSLHLAVLIGLYRFGDLDSDRYLLVPIGFSIVTTVLFFAMTLNDQLRRVAAARSGRIASVSGASTWRSIATIPTDYGTVCLVFLLWGWQLGFLIGYLLLFVAHAAFLALASVKWFHDMRALDSAT